MVYEAFQTIITAELNARLGEGYQLLVQKVPRNNGAILNGLCISKKGEPAAPTIYLNDYFKRHKKGAPLEALVDEILYIYAQNSDLMQRDFTILQDFSQLKDKIAYKLIHTCSNLELLKNIPSIPYHDLSIVFYLFLEENEYGQMTSLIHNSHMAKWNTSLDQLHQLASENMPRILPPVLRSMAQVMGELIRKSDGLTLTDELVSQIIDSSGISPLYVLTNSSGINGACTILYPEVLKNFAQLLRQDLVILPSSIHKVLLLPFDDNVLLDDLSVIVTHVNQTEVPMEARLSNQAYFYSRQTDTVHLVQGSAPFVLS